MYYRNRSEQLETTNKMKQHRFFSDALMLLATMENTLPEILLALNPETTEGIETNHKLRVICNYTDLIYLRGGSDAKLNALQP